jgi:hypothetical protein
MHKHQMAISAAILATVLGQSGAMAAPDWGKVPEKRITAFYPGIAAMEWVTKGSEHSGSRGLKKGESCASCHDEEAADVGKKIVSGEKLEPKPLKGKAGSIPVAVQAAYDKDNLYLRFSWKEPAGGGDKLDKDNQVKLAVMFAGDKIPMGSQVGCWLSCHQDVRTMPNATDNKKLKYVADANLASGVFYDLIQWTSKGAKHDGYVADKRVMDGGKALMDAKGEKKGGTWTVTFTRKLTGGEGDVGLAEGKTIPFGFAIHDDYAGGRFHHVSLGYSLGIGAKADVTATKQ